MKHKSDLSVRISTWFFVSLTGIIVAGLILAVGCAICHARDLEGKYANSPLKSWFDSLRSKQGSLCCSLADGQETEYDIRDGKYWVPIDGVWTEVPDHAVIEEPNKFGRPMVWLFFNDGKKAIRCFIPGAGM